MKNTILGLLLAVATTAPLAAQPIKLPVYGEIGLGIGQTLFRGNTKANLQKALGGSFEPGIGNNLMMGFYVAPENWKGLGIGSRIRGTFGIGVKGDAGDQYIFNYYNLALSAKYYPGGQFNQGLYGRASVGFGQFTSKRVNESNKAYTHQYGIGSSVMVGGGYSFPLRRSSLSVEAEWESSQRAGTVNNVGDVTFGSGQLGLNIILSY